MKSHSVNLCVTIMYKIHKVTQRDHAITRRGNSRNQSSADWQSVYPDSFRGWSRIGNPLVPSNANARPTASRGYGRLPTCATSQRGIAEKLAQKNKTFIDSSAEDS